MVKIKVKKLLYPLFVFSALVAATSLLPKSEQDIRDSIIKLVSDTGECSAEQIQAPSGQNYVLTAAHCRGLAIKAYENEDYIEGITESGHKFLLKVLTEDPESDLLLLAPAPFTSALKIANSLPRHIRTFTHGNNLDTYKTEGEIVQTSEVEIPFSMALDGDPFTCDLTMLKYQKKDIDYLGMIFHLCLLSVSETTTTAMIVPGSSGGAAVNDKGELVGVVSAGDGHFGMLVTLDDIQQFLADK